MKKSLKNKIALGGMALATLVAPIATVVSCGSSSSTLNPKGTLTIARWGNAVESASQDAAIARFEQLNNVKVTTITLDYGKRIEQISKWAASGNLPDIIETDGSDYSSYAASNLIKPLDVSKIDKATLSGLIPQTLGTMYGHLSGADHDKWVYDAIPTDSTAPKVTLNKDQIEPLKVDALAADHLWGVPKEFNTLGVYVNVGALKNPVEAKKAWEASIAASKRTNNDLYAVLKDATNGLKDTNSGLVAKTSTNVTGAISFTNDPNRFTQFFSEADYNKFKGYTLDEIKNDKTAIATAIKGWWDRVSAEYTKLNVSGCSITSQGHGYGWNGEAFDKKSVAAVIEGAWFTPSTDVYTDAEWDIWTAPDAGLFPQGWALTTNSNDDDLANKFFSYMAGKEGSRVETSLTGANPVNIESFDEQLNDAKAGKPNAAMAKKITAHGDAVSANARPLLFTAEYPAFQKAWQDEFMTWVDPTKAGQITQNIYNTTVDKVMDAWIKNIQN